MAASVVPANDGFPEERKKVAIFTFGRFQPPTIGHKVLIEGIETAANEENADAYIFVSSSQDNKKNPLLVTEKIKILQKQYPDRSVHFINTKLHSVTQPTQAIYKLIGLAYEKIIMYVGSDRIENFTKMVQSMSEEAKSKVEIRLVGDERNEGNNSNNVSNLSKISASKARRFAVEGKDDLFSSVVKFGEVENTNVSELRNTIRGRLPKPISEVLPRLSGTKRRATGSAPGNKGATKKGGYKTRKARRTRKSFRSHK
jgi:nicotinic acid mononucleotide adenylyltransferase